MLYLLGVVEEVLAIYSAPICTLDSFEGNSLYIAAFLFTKNCAKDLTENLTRQDLLIQGTVR